MTDPVVHVAVRIHFESVRQPLAQVVQEHLLSNLYSHFRHGNIRLLNNVTNVTRQFMFFVAIRRPIVDNE